MIEAEQRAGAAQAAMPMPSQAAFGAAEPQYNKGSARMFRSDFLEKFSHVHPATPAVLYLPLAAVFMVMAFRVVGSQPLGVAARIVGGYVAWTVTEYWLHRLVFHVKIVGRKTERLYFYVHGVHHDWPWDFSRLVIPPGASLALCGIFWLLFRLLFGGMGLYPWFAGYLIGYVMYDTVHWYVHARVPKTRFFKWLRREHMVHHFKAPQSRFGVSCPWMDHLFGTTQAKPSA